MKKLTLETINKLVEKIRKVKDDDEKAHSMESDLRDKFIRSLIVHDYTSEEIKQMSALVLETNQIEFSRWFS